MTTKSVTDEVFTERLRQDEKWGGVKNDDSNTLNDWNFYIKTRLRNEDCDGEELRKLFIEIAALSVAAVESLDRHDGELPKQS